MKDRIKEKYPDDNPMYFNGCDSAIIGYDSLSKRVIYSRALLADALVMMGSTLDEADGYIELMTRDLSSDKNVRPIVADTLRFTQEDDHSSALINVIPINDIDGNSRFYLELD